MKKYITLFFALLLSGCLFGDGFESEIKDNPSASAPPCEVGFCTTTATADKAADQWMPFEFDFTTTLIGTYFFLENAPSWMKVNKVDTKIYGTPTAPAVYTDVNIHIYDGTNTEIIGPFTLTVTGDPLAIYAWHMRNTGQKNFASNGGKSGQDINALGAYDLGFTGNGVEILVSDTGVEINHEDLENNISSGRSFDFRLGTPFWGDPEPGPEDGEFHGTAVAGIIGAEALNSLGSRGVAPNADIAGANYISSEVTPDADMTFEQAANDFDIYNYSYGYPQCYYTPIDDALYAQLIAQSTTQRGGLGSIYVKSAGNDFVSDLGVCTDNPVYDGIPYFGNANMDGSNTLPYVIVVGALNANGKSASYSSPGANLWVSAPGGEFGTSSPAIIAPDLTGCTVGASQSDLTGSDLLNTFENGHATLNANCSYTSTMNGTSSAAPIVSGVVALMLEANPTLSWRDVKDILARTATRVDKNAGSTKHPYRASLLNHTYQYGWVKNKAGFYFHNWYGFGRVDAGKAVAAALTHTTLPAFVDTYSPSGEAYYSAFVSLSIPNESATGRTSNITVLHNLIIEAVNISITINHEFFGDLEIELISPSGTKSKLMNIDSFIVESGVVTLNLLSNAFYGESSAGNWKVKVVDGAPTDVGQLTKWSVNVYGHVNPDPDDVTPPTAPVVTAPTDHDSDEETPEVTWSHATPADVMRYEVSVGTTAGDDDIAPWQSVGKVISAQIEDLTLVDGETYFFNVRAVDAAENVSPVANDSWVVDL